MDPKEPKPYVWGVKMVVLPPPIGVRPSSFQGTASTSIEEEVVARKLYPGKKHHSSW